jgi:hypothetical protein
MEKYLCGAIPPLSRKIVEEVTLRTCIKEMTDSNLGHGTNSPE